MRTFTSKLATTLVLALIAQSLFSAPAQAAASASITVKRMQGARTKHGRPYLDATFSGPGANAVAQELAPHAHPTWSRGVGIRRTLFTRSYKVTAVGKADVRAALEILWRD